MKPIEENTLEEDWVLKIQKYRRRNKTINKKVITTEKRSIYKVYRFRKRKVFDRREINNKNT